MTSVSVAFDPYTIVAYGYGNIDYNIFFQINSKFIFQGQFVIVDTTLGYIYDLTRFNKIAIQGTPQMAADKGTISLSRFYSYYSVCSK